ncbi:hypothetical protein B0A49_05731 [Cryomyces minteri]|uniref:PXA domain-containing protein n=1 Tax=Cryomyces minteri TaxID=331657 RepID=A0A4U0XB40_9PEZI|nr:hypothetical protein B0A49_05731 [Cryomyces minteri]
MALSRKDIILACIAAFISWGFITDWVPTLRWIPYAFVGGIATSIVALIYVVLSTSRGSQNVQARPAYPPKTPAFCSPEAWQAETASLRSRSSYSKKSIFPPSAAISRSIDGLLDLVIRDFVTSWYGRISSRPLFQNEVDRSIRAALFAIQSRLNSLDLVGITVSRIVPIITQHMEDVYDAERIVRGKSLSRNITESEELDLAIAKKYKNGVLHPATSLTYSSSRPVQQQHLRVIVQKLLPKLLPDNMLTSPSVSILIQEIVACAVLFPVMQMLADPDTWNQIMESYGRTMLHDRKTVRKLRAALDEHSPQPLKPSRSQPYPRLALNDSERTFERYIRFIRQCNTLSDARRFRSEVASQIRREAAVEGQDQTYLRRLETARRLLDQRVAPLDAQGAARPKLSVQPSAKLSGVPPTPENASLKDILHNPSGLSYFMEYMDRVGLMRLVQFWVVVDGFRNPLEEDADDLDEASQIRPTWTESDRNDLALISEAYLSRPELKVPSESREQVRSFLKSGNNATAIQYNAARRAVLKAQTSVYVELRDRHFPFFRKSDLYYKWLAMEVPASAASTRPAESLNTPRESRNTSPSRPSNIPRMTSWAAAKEPDLRRAVASSSDLKAFAKAPEGLVQTRRSLDSSAPRAPLFEDDLDDDPLAHSTQSIQSVDSEVDQARKNGETTRIVDAMQLALTDIIEDEPDKDLFLPEPSIRGPQNDESTRSSFESQMPPAFSRPTEREKPSLASLGLVGAPSRRGVFSDDGLFGEEEKFLEDEREDSDANEKVEEDDVHEAAPGDLGLAEAIDGLTADIERLVAQESIIDSLNKKAELTNNAAELRILRKSKQSLQGEIHTKELQRQQYIVQESDNSLFGRATVTIKSVMVGREEDGREFALYVIEVCRQAGEQIPAATWAITRRYSEFHALNKRLRARYSSVRHIEFPRRQTLFTLQKDFLQKRRVALERYLRELLLIPVICRSRELRAFLSQQAISSHTSNGSQIDTRDFVTRIYNSVTDGMEEFLGNIPVLDQLSVAGQNLISAATAQLNVTPTNGMNGMSNALANNPATAAEAEAELSAFESRELEPFVKPICDLFLEVFQLNRGNNWLRGRAVVVVLHQLLGGTIERKLRDSAKALGQEESVVKYINVVKDMMWPGGKMRPPPSPRTDAEKSRSKEEAGLLLATLIPDLASNVVGRVNAQGASRRVFACLNNHRLNTHLAYTLLDEIVQIVFGESALR